MPEDKTLICKKSECESSRIELSGYKLCTSASRHVANKVVTKDRNWNCKNYKAGLDDMFRFYLQLAIWSASTRCSLLYSAKIWTALRVYSRWES